jgi:hypothetical protein
MIQISYIGIINIHAFEHWHTGICTLSPCDTRDARFITRATRHVHWQSVPPVPVDHDYFLLNLSHWLHHAVGMQALGYLHCGTEYHRRTKKLCTNVSRLCLF